jgi:mono/diheme cytochrome c family protein
MWTESRLRNVARPVMSEQQAMDLLAFFYSLRFFEEPGDAGRGKALFGDRKCSACHGVNTPIAGNAAPPVIRWTAPTDQLALVETMWNHSSKMRDEMARINISLPTLTGQNVADLLVFVRSTQGLARRAYVFQTLSAEAGAGLFQSKGCAGCHGPQTHFLTIGLENKTLTDIAADMWNHGAAMGISVSMRNTTFEPGQMGSIAAYIWSRRMIENYGLANRGARVFEAKKCGTCHNDPLSGAPPLTTGRLQFNSATMVSLLTRHGPSMLSRMQEKKLAWPHFTGDEMADLISYLNIRTAPNGR